MSAKTSVIEIVARDPEAEPIDDRNLTQIREKILDKTIADFFPASDLPSSDPAPAADRFAA